MRFGVWYLIRPRVSSLVGPLGIMSLLVFALAIASPAASGEFGRAAGSVSKTIVSGIRYVSDATALTPLWAVGSQAAGVKSEILKATRTPYQP